MNFITQTISVPAWWLGVGALAVIGLYSSNVHDWIAMRGVPERDNAGSFFGGILGILFLLTCAGFHRSLPWGLVGGLVCLFWAIFIRAMHLRSGH